jgi:hypothetical protein
LVQQRLLQRLQPGVSRVRLAIPAQTLLPGFGNARLTLEAWHPKKLATSDA